MDLLRNYVKTVLSFVLFLRVISLLFPDSSYEKYIRPVGMLLLALIAVRPFLGVSFSAESLWNDTYREFLLQNDSQAMDGIQVKDGYTAAVLSEYRNRLKEQLDGCINDMGYMAETVRFELAEGPDDFGTILSLQAVLYRMEQEKRTGIEPVHIISGRQEKGDKGVIKTAEELSVRDRLSELFRLSKEQVDVTIGEE